jgi:uncharacterized delta-60 repeat protein
MIRRATLPLVSAFVLLLSVAPAAMSAPGHLDPTFGGDGIVRTDLTRFGDYGFAIALQPDGKIVVAGTKGLGGQNARVAVVRYATDGSLDPSFGGGDGKASIDFTPREDFAYAVRIQTDGKIVVAGPAAYFAHNSKFGVARLTPDGAPDPTFGGDGIVVTDLSPSSDFANGVALQANGKIVVVGSVSAGADNGKVGVLRFRSDGSLDPLFSGDGKVLFDPTSTFDDGFAIGVEPDGQIVVAGAAGVDGPHERFVLIALTRRGSLDPSLGGDGMVFTDVTPKADDPLALAIQADGRIVVVGTAALHAPDPKFAVVRYERDGSLDATFGGDGVVITNLTSDDDEAYSVAIAPDGKIVAAGWAGNDGQASRPGVVRYLVDGTPDTTFGGDGIVTTHVSPGFDSAYGVAVQPDGSVVASGNADAGGDPAFAVLRYQP